LRAIAFKLDGVSIGRWGAVGVGDVWDTVAIRIGLRIVTGASTDAPLVCRRQSLRIGN
jgi:hypothetical protein